MQGISVADYFRRNQRFVEKKEFVERRRANYAEVFEKVLCGVASGYAFLILFVLAFDASGMSFGRIGQIGEQVFVRLPVPLLPQTIVLWDTTVETLELAKIIVILSLFVIYSVISSFIFLQIKNIYNIFLLLGLEYLPIPFVGNHLKAQGSALYFMLFIIGVCLICYSIVLRTFLKQNCHGYP